MYHFKGAPPGVAPPYQQPRPNQSAAYSSPPQGQPGQYGPYAAYQQQTQQPAHGQFASTQQPQAPGVYHSSQLHHTPGAYAANQNPHYHQQKQAPGSTQALRAGGMPYAAAYQSSNQACYNCGCSDHWAQNCPEPRRAVPAGSLNASRPLKRQKTAGPIVTRYPPPPNHSSPPSLQRGFTHPPAGHQTFPAPPGPPTPLSANGQSYNVWRPQQNPFGSQAPRHPSVPWSPPVPTPMSSNGPQYASPVSINSGGQHQSYFNAQSQSLVSQGSTPRNPIPPHSSSTIESGVYPKQPGNSSRRQSVSSDRNQVPDAKGENVEPWLEELQALDFTEGKVGSGPIISHPANPVAQPLPADCATADAMGRLPIAASLPPGVPISLYLRDLDEWQFEQNVRDKAEWTEVCHDPAFAEISSNCDAISVSELIRRRQEAALVLDGSDDEANGRDDDSHSRDQDTGDERHTRQRSYSDGPMTPSESRPPLSRERRGASIPGDQTHPRRPAEQEGAVALAGETQDQRLSREQEERLAALGVSGVPKPVQPSMRRTVTVTQPAPASLGSPMESLDGQRRSASLDKRAPGADDRASLSPESLDGRSRDQSRELSRSDESPYRTGSASRASPRRHFSRETSYPDRNGRGRLSRYGSYDERHPPPPPPPPPAREHRYVDGPPGRRSSPIDNHGPDAAPNSHGRSPTDADANHFDAIRSPSRSRADPPLGRKRSYRHSSEESEDGPKRQAEENAQQRKRKHPKVADAYSRRW